MVEIEPSQQQQQHPPPGNKSPRFISTGPIDFKRTRASDSDEMVAVNGRGCEQQPRSGSTSSSARPTQGPDHQASAGGQDDHVVEEFENMSIDDDDEYEDGRQASQRRQQQQGSPSAHPEGRGSVRRFNRQKSLNGTGRSEVPGNTDPSSSSSSSAVPRVIPAEMQHEGQPRREHDRSEEEGDQAQVNGESARSMARQGRRKKRKVDVCHVEVRLSPFSNLLQSTVTSIVRAYILDTFDRLEVGAELEEWREEVQALASDVDRIVVAECASTDPFPFVSDLRLEVHVYRSSGRAALDQFAASTGDDDDDNEPGVMAATVRDLPSRELDGLWDTLVYDEDIKPRLLDYIHTTLLFSDSGVDFDVVTWNRLVLLHGPPGTGKTSLCRALAQKLAIRLSSRYSSGKLVEINSHSLFSKWFSESGKLVQRLFSRVTEMMEDESCFVVVLIDEVESLTAARAGAMSGTEPSDALRVVNALLTQLDQLKRRRNALVMSTSNIAQAIDSAFVDRADIKQYIGLPPPRAIHWVLRGCLTELMRAGIVRQQPLLDWATVEAVRDKPSTSRRKEEIRRSSLRLVNLAERCKGMSGRTLRRLPVLAHARYIGTNAVDAGESSGSEKDDDDDDDIHDLPTARQWIAAMERVVGDEQEQVDKLEELVGTGKV